MDLVPIDKSKTYLVSISGGKDSTAMWLYLKHDLGISNIIPMFADTGWEHPLTYDYLNYLETAIDPIIRVKPPLDFVQLSKDKKRFPSAKARFCTRELKMVPCKEWLDQQLAQGSLVGADIIQCSGVRHEESPARAKMAEWVDKDDFYNMRQWRPIISWTWQEVFAMHDKHGIDANPLYKQGMGRVGCMPCIMSNMKEIGEISRRFPEVLEKIENAELSVIKGNGETSCFFTPDTIPERFRSRTHIDKDGKVFKLSTPRDVFEYAKLEKPERHYGGKMTALFTEPENEDIGTCSSIYGLCE